MDGALQILVCWLIQREKSVFIIGPIFCGINHHSGNRRCCGVGAEEEHLAARVAHSHLAEGRPFRYAHHVLWNCLHNNHVMDM